VVTIRHQVPDQLTPARQETRTFRTFTDDLHALRAWLVEEGITHVCLESTGSYWKPVYNLLEDTVVVWLINPSHVKPLRGRKTDVKDSQWLAELLAFGLVVPSFIPDKPQRELREAVRYRRSLIEERAREVNRIQKVLEGGNIKLGSVISDVLGVSGRAMLTAIAQGATQDLTQLAGLADRRIRASAELLAQALTGLVGDHQRWMLTQQLRHLSDLEALITDADQEIARRTRPFEEARTLLDSIPGVQGRVADVILAEVGPTVEPFRSAAALAKWTGVAPGNKTSGGKRLSGRTTPGNRALRSALVEAARGAGRTKSTYMGAQYRRLVPRIGPKRAAMAVAHSICQRIWIVLDRREPYADLGVDYFDRRDTEAVKRRAIRRLADLGYQVTLEPITL
jgi:transposase